MHFDLKMWFYILLGILFAGFILLSCLSVRVLLRQKNIVVKSRMGRETGLMEVLDVNISLFVIVFLVVKKLYIYIPLIACFAFFLLTITRLQSGISNEGIFIGMTFIPWDRVNAYKLVNDDINTIQLRFRANKRQYIMRCDKKQKGDIAAILRKYNIPLQETIHSNQPN